MAAWEGKKYQLVKSENLDAYMKAIGVDADKHKLADSAAPTVTLVKNGDEYEYATTSTMRNQVIKFKPGVEFDMDTLDGSKIKTVCNFETPNKLVLEQKGDKAGKITREFTDTELVSTHVFNGVTAKRYYKAI
ncbi:unnamed protein product [Hermetia illucens]|uniref:Lipocalin/cytosolic fatty-acid binding domain-containing protein n=1 Tax=Hermetia illucens TaxID=343691 RepID=A0A7R8V739_HERIL|nr:probable fatty acid-binding protein [Hermetia illucens]CAD7093315.1 unnamed protein product [Hermetia illucens]